jgi:hypothetical protein
MAIVAKAVKANTLKTIKQAAIAADQVLVLKTPVDTGRARANWIVSIGSPAPGEITGYTKRNAGSIATEQGRIKALSYKLGKGGIYITNNVAYITLLDAGSSVQRPKGMTAAAIKAAQKVLGSAKLLDGV